MSDNFFCSTSPRGNGEPLTAEDFANALNVLKQPSELPPMVELVPPPSRSGQTWAAARHMLVARRDADGVLCWYVVDDEADE